MEDHGHQELEGVDLAKGLPMFSSAKPEALAKEKERLRAVEHKGVFARWKVFFSMSGPGWMQSAMTLGAGSSAASLFAGAFLGY